MCKTPKYKEMAAANKSVLLWRKKETKSKPKYSLFTRLKRYFFPAKKRSIEETIAAAMIIQDAYRAKLAARAAKKKIEEELRLREMRKENRHADHHHHHHHHNNNHHHNSHKTDSHPTTDSHVSLGASQPGAVQIEEA
jgi:hypothetical protein